MIDSLRDGCPTSLFHSGLGSVSPVALTLELTAVPDDSEQSLDVVAGALGALLHERHHWLQHVGTVVGVFSSLLIELQAGIAIGAVPLDEIGPGDLPLLTSRWTDEPGLIFWRRVEATRRMVIGCRRNDFEILERNGFPPEFTLLSKSLRTMVADVASGSDTLAALLDRWNDFLVEPNERPAVIEERGRLFGARYLMEGAARRSEMFRIADLWMKDHRGPYDASALFAGDYGVADSVFRSQVAQWSPATEVGFAFACDLALNGFYPPIAPASGDAVTPGWAPGVCFAYVCSLLKGFPFGDHQIDLYDPEEVRALLDALADHVGDSFAMPHAGMADLVQASFGHLDAETEAARVFRLVDGELPEPTRQGSRIRYGLAQMATAYRLRREMPELFVFPVCWYVADRKRFREHFDRIQPPLLSYGGRGIAPSRPETGWLEFFLAAAVTHEAIRGALVCEPDDLASRLLPFARSYGGDEHGRSVLQRALWHTFRGGPLADDLWQRMERRLGTSQAPGHPA